MLHLNLTYNDSQSVVATPRDRLTCCEEVIWVFQITSPLTGNGVRFLPPMDSPGDSRWDTFNIILVEDVGDSDPIQGIIHVTTAGTWDYLIFAVDPLAPDPFADSAILQECETGLLKISVAPADVPAYSTNQITPVYPTL